MIFLKIASFDIKILIKTGFWGQNRPISLQKNHLQIQEKIKMDLLLPTKTLDKIKMIFNLIRDEDMIYISIWSSFNDGLVFNYLMFCGKSICNCELKLEHGVNYFGEGSIYNEKGISEIKEVYFYNPAAGFELKNRSEINLENLNEKQKNGLYIGPNWMVDHSKLIHEMELKIVELL